MLEHHGHVEFTEEPNQHELFPSRLAPVAPQAATDSQLSRPALIFGRSFGIYATGTEIELQMNRPTSDQEIDEYTERGVQPAG